MQKSTIQKMYFLLKRGMFQLSHVSFVRCISLFWLGFCGVILVNCSNLNSCELWMNFLGPRCWDTAHRKSFFPSISHGKSSYNLGRIFMCYFVPSISPTFQKESNQTKNRTNVTWSNTVVISYTLGLFPLPGNSRRIFHASRSVWISICHSY